MKNRVPYLSHRDTTPYLYLSYLLSDSTKCRSRFPSLSSVGNPTSLLCSSISIETTMMVL